MNNIKLNKIKNFQLTDVEKQDLRGGEAGTQIVCWCGCCYANNSGSSKEDNGNANKAKKLSSKPKEDCQRLYLY